MKRAWTKKVKSLPSSAIGNEALEAQLQPHPKVKRRIFRTSAAMIGLTVSIGTPNFLLTQAAQVPEGMSSQSVPIKDTAAPETGQNTLATETYRVMPVEPVPIYQVSTPLSYDRDTPKQPTAKKVAPPSYSQPAPVVQASVPEVSFTPELQPSSQVAPQEPVVEPDVRAILRQHQQSVSLEQTPAIATPAVNSQTSRLITQLKASKKTEIANTLPTEVVSTQINANSSPLAVRPPQVAVNHLEANSAWTAKQRLLVAQLKNQQNSSPVNSEEVVQVPSDIDLASSTTPPSQPRVELPAPVVAVPSTEQALPQQTSSETPAAVANSDGSMEFVAQPLPTEAMVLPTTATLNQDLAPTFNQIAQPLPAITAATEQSTQKLQPVFVLPEASIAQAQENTTPIEAEKVEEQKVAAHNILKIDEQQVAVKDNPKEIENVTSGKAALINVNEPIIVSSTTLEYQVKPGDTLTTIASEHRLSLPEIANFNKLPNPNLLLVDQKLKIPALTSMKTQANVIVLPPIEKVEPLAEVSSLPAPTLQLANKVTLVSTEQKIGSALPAPAYTGVGGSISDAEVETKPLDRPALNQLQRQYAQNLQNDVQNLQHKYYAQNSSNITVPAQAVESDRIPAAIKPSLNLDDEPINPEFRVAQTSQDLKPTPQQQLVNKAKYSTPATGRVATAPTSVNSSDDSLTGQQVTPELPPLAPALNYLPQPNALPFNGYMWPAKGVLTSPYGRRWGRMHKGIDIAAPVGTPIFAVAPGVVIKAGWNKGGYGNLVDIQHADGTLTRYAHNYRLLVQPGQIVEQGQQISLMGSTGYSTGPHLHFEVHPGGKSAVNPIAFLPKDR